MSKIYWENKGFNELMQGAPISKMEQDIMMQKLDEVKALFLQTFGFEGNFSIESYVGVGRGTHAGRITWKIVANDSKTTAALKKQSGWLKQFVN